MDKKQTIKLTEQDLHMLVEDAVRTYLNENGIDEGGWSALLGAGKNAVQGKFNNMRQGATNLRNNENATFQAGRNLTMIQRYKTNIENSLTAIEKMDADLQAPIEQLKQQLEMTLQKYEGRLKTAQANTFSTKNYNQQ